MPGMGSASKIVDAICRERASACKVYVNPEDLAGYNFWTQWKFENQTLALEDCWYWQLGYWIMEDVFATVRQCNQKKVNVYSSPVKRLQKLSFVRVPDAGAMEGGGYGMEGYTDYGMMGMDGTGGENSGADTRPKYVASLKDVITRPLTGRLNSDSIHVVQFGMAVVVDARQALWFMEQLCSAKEHTFDGFAGKQPPRRFEHNQITILESSMRSFQREVGPHALYRYGEAPVVELNLVCEYLFDAGAYKEIMPEVVVTAMVAGQGI
jgi:hypothetical protein